MMGYIVHATSSPGCCCRTTVLRLQEESYFVGRVVCEVEGGALNDTAVVLEGDSHISEGGRAQLDLSQLQTYRLFPGQVRDGDKDTQLKFDLLQAECGRQSQRPASPAAGQICRQAATHMTSII
eukprot:GHUV01039499.1.p1 GENE.GHUV01039499.1~~GHUV01039499.1.p1  ORF type:complete len:124 (+),score=28.66 GHUV01039499.1:143-514(+)